MATWIPPQDKKIAGGNWSMMGHWVHDDAPEAIAERKECRRHSRSILRWLFLINCIPGAIALSVGQSIGSSVIIDLFFTWPLWFVFATWLGGLHWETKHDKEQGHYPFAGVPPPVRTSEAGRNQLF